MKKRTRRRIMSLETLDQLRLVSSSVAVEVVQVLRRRGPASVAEIGAALGRNGNALHYHVRKLLRAGMVQEVDSRRSGARTEAIYDVVADEFVGDSAPRDARRRKLTNDAVASLLRLATRNFIAATERPAELTTSGRCRNLTADRFSARLTRSQLAALNGHMKAIEELFLDSVGSEKGQLCAITMVLTPTPDEKRG